jgi:mRNA interferase MazF
MRRCGDVELADLGEPRGRDAGFARPVVLVTAQLVLEQGPTWSWQVVPLTSRIRGYRSEVTVEPDPGNSLVTSAAPCEHILTDHTGDVEDPRGGIRKALPPRRPR